MSARLNALAERVFVQAETATEPEAVQAAALTVEKLYRGMRLCMGFEARVVREHRRTVREDEAQSLKVGEQVRARQIERIKQAVSATFGAEYEAERDTCEDPDAALRKLLRHLAAVGDAVTGAEPEIDPSGDVAAQIEELRKLALMMSELSQLEVSGDRTAAAGRWRGSG